MLADLGILGAIVKPFWHTTEAYFLNITQVELPKVLNTSEIYKKTCQKSTYIAIDRLNIGMNLLGLKQVMNDRVRNPGQKRGNRNGQNPGPE